MGHTKHTWYDIDAAIRHTMKVIRVKSSFSGKATAASQLVWLGYQCLCLAKRPNLRKPFNIVKAPFYVLKGLQYLRRGVIRNNNVEQ
jgi:hypothetical protein